MTLGQMIDEARRKARVHASDQNDQLVSGYLNEGILRFSEQCGGIQKSQSFAVIPRFWVSAKHGIKLQTDGFGPQSFSLTGSDLERVDGDELAAAIQLQFRTILSNPSITVVWDHEDFTFTIAIPGATSVVVEEPDGAYLDGTIFVGGDWVITGDTYTTARYTGYTCEADMPAGIQEIASVKYRGKSLRPASFYSEHVNHIGVPTSFSFEGDRLRIFPMLSSYGGVEVEYKGMFKRFSLSGPIDSSQTTDIPSESELAPVYYAASVMAENRFEYETSSRLLGQFHNRVSWYRLNRENDSTKIGFGPEVGVKVMVNGPVNL
jgi:hypothetical protein